jgi:lipoprotein-anchoring transpeptidase ErfK/SrfK
MTKALRRFSALCGGASVVVLAVGIAIAVTSSPSKGQPAAHPPAPPSVIGPTTGSSAAPRDHAVLHHVPSQHSRSRHASGTAHAGAGKSSAARSHRGHIVAPASDVAQVPRETVLAALHGRTAGYSTATATTAAMMVPGAWYGRSSVLPVVNQSATRVKVRLARRPNESTIWVDRRDVSLDRSTDAIVVDISAHRLYVFRDGAQRGSYPVGVGVPATPTPTGTYFLAFHAPPNGPGYGPVMLETSAHSTAFTTFEGGNDAIIAIHGPISSYADAAIGSHGVAISNGCIRMHDSDLVKVARVRDGSPIILTR